MNSNSGATIVLVYPRFKPPFVKYETIAPLPVLAVASPLLQNGYKVVVVDANVEDDYDAALARIEGAPLCFGISAMLGYQVKDALKWTELIKEKFPNSPIVWGGWFATVVPEEPLERSEISAVIRGQGEESFLAYVKALENGGDISKLPEVYSRGDDGIVNGGRREAVDPNDYPSTPYHLLDMERYSKIKSGLINYNSSYGCPNYCQFCSIHMLKQRRIFKGLAPERVVSDLAALKERYGIDTVEFHDDEFLNDKDRAAGIFEEMLRKDLGIEFMCNGRANDIVEYEPDKLRLLKRAGVKSVGVGVESGSEEVLKRIRKGITKEQVFEVAARFKEFDIPVQLNFMCGHHGETPEEFKETLLMMEKLKRIYPKASQTIFFFIPLPGSAFFEEDVRDGKLIKPSSMDEWAEYWTANPSGWFAQENRRFFKDDRDIFKKMSFYYVLYNFDNFPPLLTRRTIGKLLKPALSLGARVRFKLDFYRAPLLWKSARGLIRMISQDGATR
jgi:radical SAM superfamily enzyme YgiQ (UPF0313 family)